MGDGSEYTIQSPVGKSGRGVAMARMSGMSTATADSRAMGAAGHTLGSDTDAIAAFCLTCGI
jgi:hypothetical protein